MIRIHRITVSSDGFTKLLDYKTQHYENGNCATDIASSVREISRFQNRRVDLDLEKPHYLSPRGIACPCIRNGSRLPRTRCSVIFIARLKSFSPSGDRRSKGSDLNPPVARRVLPLLYSATGIRLVILQIPERRFATTTRDSARSVLPHYHSPGRTHIPDYPTRSLLISAYFTKPPLMYKSRTRT